MTVTCGALRSPEGEGRSAHGASPFHVPPSAFHFYSFQLPSVHTAPLHPPPRPHVPLLEKVPMKRRGRKKRAPMSLFDDHDDDDLDLRPRTSALALPLGRRDGRGRRGGGERGIRRRRRRRTN